MFGLYNLSNFESRAISAENFRGEKGRGGMATEGTGKECASDLGQGWKISPSVEIQAGETFEVANIDGSGIIRHIWMAYSATENRSLIIRIYWDGSETPSVEVPLGDFFVAADDLNPQQLSSLAVCVNPHRALNCYWEMPFKKKCRITIENIHTEPIDKVSGSLIKHIGEDIIEFDVGNNQAVLCTVLFADIEVGKFPAITHQIPKLSDIRRRNNTAGNKVMLEYVRNPFCVFFVGFLDFDCFHIFRVSKNDIAGWLQNVVNGNPVFTRRLHAHIPAVVFGKPRSTKA